jgi:excisionase family DNA binding protein
MDDLLTTRQVQALLKIDRITIYRMLSDGRLKGVKIGSQWRFTPQEVERLLSGEAPREEAAPASGGNFPTHCVQTIQNLFAAVSQISALCIDLQGELLTQPTGLCGLCQLMQQSPSGREACRSSWQETARQTINGEKFFTCHAGIQYIAAPFKDEDGKTAGFFLAGQFYWRSPAPADRKERMERLASEHHLSIEELERAEESVPVIEPALHARVEQWPLTAALAIESILQERTRFVQRLQQIANLTQI